MTAQDLLETAKKLSELIEMPVDKNLSDRDLKDFGWQMKTILKSNWTIEWWRAFFRYLNNMRQTVEKVTEEEINFSDAELEAATIFKRMNSAQSLSTVFIKTSDVSDQELAVVAENMVDLPGISTGTDWTRKIVEGSSLASLIGTVTSEEQGIPEEVLDEFLEKVTHVMIALDVVI